VDRPVGENLACGMKEAVARIKINKQLENAGWRFFADASGSANIQMEHRVTLKSQDLDGLGENPPVCRATALLRYSKR
jgi:hypothetical protein